MTTRIRTIITAASLLFTAAPVLATPLNLTLGDQPDIVSGFISVDYFADSDVLQASGFSFVLDTGTDNSIFGGTFDLIATVDGSGSLVGGTLTVGGTIPDLGYNSNTLLTGILTGMGFSDSGLLEFVFDVTGGDAAGLYGLEGGVLLSQSGFSGDWTSDFSSFGLAFADIGRLPVDEPATLLLLTFGLALLWRRR